MINDPSIEELIRIVQEERDDEDERDDRRRIGCRVDQYNQPLYPDSNEDN